MAVGTGERAKKERQGNQMAKVSKEQNRKMRRVARSKPRVDQEPVKGKEGKEKRREGSKAAEERVRVC